MNSSLEAVKEEMVKEEVLFGIKKLIDQYPLLRLTGFKVAISNYISIALKNHCPFTVDEAELDALWSGEKKT